MEDGDRRGIPAGDLPDLADNGVGNRLVFSNGRMGAASGYRIIAFKIINFVMAKACRFGGHRSLGGFVHIPRSGDEKDGNAGIVAANGGYEGVDARAEFIVGGAGAFVVNAQENTDDVGFPSGKIPHRRRRPADRIKSAQIFLGKTRLSAETLHQADIRRGLIRNSNGVF